MTLSSVNYAGEPSEKIIFKGKEAFPKVNLSPISTEILSQSIQDKILVVFARGSLNLTPLIASLRISKNDKNIFIGIPSNIYSKINKKYSDDFSALYKDNGLFYYDGVLWCTAEINSTGIETNLGRC